MKKEKLYTEFERFIHIKPKDHLHYDGRFDRRFGRNKLRKQRK